MAKILLVDDDVELTELLAELLVFDGFEIVVAHNGLQALEKLDPSFDLVLLDVMMPLLNGFETLKRIRNEFDVPVLMLTARDDDADRVLGLELGADDYLAKPFNDRELVARIKAILRRTSGHSAKYSSAVVNKEDQGYLEFRGLTLFLGRQQVMYQDQDLDLTATEFALLYKLILHPGEIVSREMLSVEALGKRLTPFDRSVDMHMSNLRKKLPHLPDELPWFKTLRGKGYLLVLDK